MIFCPFLDEGILLVSMGIYNFSFMMKDHHSIANYMTVKSPYTVLMVKLVKEALLAQTFRSVHAFSVHSS